jgi:hypothetical protein
MSAPSVSTSSTSGGGSTTVRVGKAWYVTEHKIRPVTTKEKIVVGARVPADVELWRAKSKQPGGGEVCESGERRGCPGLFRK